MANRRPLNMMNHEPQKLFTGRYFWLSIAVNGLWINASEIWRYFEIVMPALREAVPGSAPMSLGVFAAWGIWDTLVLFAATGFFWLWLTQFGTTIKQTIIAATLFWLAVFVVLWLGVFNLGLVPFQVFASALPLAWLEMLIAALIVRWFMQRQRSSN